MMRLETERLALLALTAGQLRLWLEDVERLEAQLGCRYRGEPVEGSFAGYIRAQLGKVEGDAGRALCHTFWFILRRDDRTVVGEMAFKGPPDAAHEVELGYGLNPEFEGSGYMTEAVKALCAWALEQEEVRRVVAETDNLNHKSECVLRRAGFTMYRQNDASTWWRFRGL